MTPEQKFGYFNRYGDMPREPKKPSSHGNLYYDGQLLHEGKPYPLLQSIKKQMINQGYLPAKIEIHKHNEQR